MKEFKTEVKEEHIDEITKQSRILRNLKSEESINLSVRMSSDSDKKIYLLENPLTPLTNAYNIEDVTRVRLKPENRLIQMDMVETTYSEYNPGLPKPRKKKPRRRCRTLTEPESKQRTKAKLKLKSVPGRRNCHRNLVVGRIEDDDVLFTPIHDFLLMRPSFDHEEELVKTEKFLKVSMENKFQRQQRLRSRKWGEECVTRESWRDCSYNEVEMSLKPPEDNPSINHTLLSQSEYLQTIIPQHNEDSFLDMPLNPSWDINALNYFKGIGCSVSLSEICKYFDRKIDPMEIVRRVSYGAHIVRNNVVPFSDHIYLKDYKGYEKTAMVENLRMLRSLYYGLMALRPFDATSYGLHKLTDVSLEDCESFVAPFSYSFLVDPDDRESTRSPKSICELTEKQSAMLKSVIKPLTAVSQNRSEDSHKLDIENSYLFGGSL